MSCSSNNATWNAGGWNTNIGRSKWKPLEIGIMVAGFIVFWPLGLAILSLKKGWLGLDRWHWGQARWAQVTGGDIGTFTRSKNMWNRHGWNDGVGRDSGNVAFEEHKRAELKRLQDEFEALKRQQDEFEAFLARLRETKDRAEFERFMAERGKTPDQGTQQA
jgi:hypothetical protein